MSELMARLRQWRELKGRNPANGSRRGRPRGSSIDDLGLLISACRMAARWTQRDDLRPEYERLAKAIEEMRRESA